MITANKQSFSAIFLAFVLCTYNMNNAVIVIDFLINQDTIAKTLCIQKEEQKGCNGKCQLAKKLNLSSDNTNNKAPQQNSKITLVDCNYIQPINSIKLITTNNYLASKIIDNTARKTIAKYYDIDLPPPLVS